MKPGNRQFAFASWNGANSHKAIALVDERKEYRISIPFCSLQEGIFVVIFKI